MEIGHTKSPSLGFSVFAGLAAFILLASQFSIVVNADPPESSLTGTAKPAEQASLDEADTNTKTEDEKKAKTQRKRLVEIAFILLAGIAMLGGLLIAMTLVIGFFYRRQSRTRTPKSPRFDPFWYLRTNSPEPDTETGDDPPLDQSNT